ncbi:type VII secretion target [Mycobacterium europaeum]|nr:type VII secretion target [Mycobacterium europaeum]
MRFDRGVRPATVARTEIDVPATHRVAAQFCAAADIIDRAVSDHLGRLAFGGVSAGRAHTAHGEALRAELERLAADVAQWSRASVEIAAALRASADQYADAELYAAARIA